MVSILPNILRDLNDPGERALDLGKVGIVEDILGDLSSDSTQKCQGAVERISVMPEQHFKTAFLGERTAQTLRGMASCLATLSWDSPHCKLLLKTISVLEVSERDLAEAGLLTTLKLLSSSSPAATGSLACQILGEDLHRDLARYTSKSVSNFRHDLISWCATRVFHSNT